MSDDSMRPAWNWKDPQELAIAVDSFTVDLAMCVKLELVTTGSCFTGAQLRDIGITGIGFAAFTTKHPTGLGSDLVGPRGPEGATERGGIYRVDSTAYFIEPLPFADVAVEWVYAAL